MRKNIFKVSGLLILSFLLTLCNLSSCKKAEVVLAPIISDFSPTGGIVGTSVTIIGHNFNASISGNSVEFNGVTATVTSATSTQLVVTVPAAATTGVITVSANGSRINSENNFTILSPTITDFSPTIGANGISVVINGTNFSSTSAYDIVKFNGTIATVTNATETQITATVPAAATTGKITVTVGPNTATSSTDFEKCSGSAELVITNLTITNAVAGGTSFNYEYDLTNVGDAAADLTQMSDQAYVSTDNADNGGDQAASGWPLGNSTLNAGQTIHVSFSSNITGGGTITTYPYLVLKIFGSVTECNTANDTVVKSIL